MNTTAKELLTLLAAGLLFFVVASSVSYPSDPGEEWCGNRC